MLINRSGYLGTGNKKLCNKCNKCGKFGVKEQPTLGSGGALFPTGIEIKELVTEKPDKNFVYKEIEEAVRARQCGRTINQLLEVNPKNFIYSETNVLTGETVNYVVPFFVNGLEITCDFNHQSTQVTVNNDSDKDESGSGGALFPSYVEGVPKYYPPRQKENESDGSGGSLYPTGVIIDETK
jgi:hypothetical protein